jgi:hypothetical protein
LEDRHFENHFIFERIARSSSLPHGFGSCTTESGGSRSALTQPYPGGSTSTSTTSGSHLERWFFGLQRID